MFKSKPLLFAALGVLLLAVILIAVTLKRGGGEVMVPTDDIATLPQGVWPSDMIREESIDQTDKGYEIRAVYPIVQSNAINAYFRTFVDEAITTFKADTAWVTEVDSVGAQSLMLDIAYDHEKTETVDNYVFRVGSYTGGAHGLQTTKTFSFSKDGKPLVLADLFTNGVDGLKTVAPYVQQELLKLEHSEKEWVAEGAAPEEINYRSFIATPTAVTFIFDPYQVAYYAAGEQRITVPVSVFKSIANKNIFAQ